MTFLCFLTILTCSLNKRQGDHTMVRELSMVHVAHVGPQYGLHGPLYALEVLKLLFLQFLGGLNLVDLVNFGLQIVQRFMKIRNHSL